MFAKENTKRVRNNFKVYFSSFLFQPRNTISRHIKTHYLVLFFWISSSLCEGLEVVDALLERVVLLLGRDALPDGVHDPVDHVALLHAAHHVRQLELVVQAALDLEKRGIMLDG